MEEADTADAAGPVPAPAPPCEDAPVNPAQAAAWRSLYCVVIHSAAVHLRM